MSRPPLVPLAAVAAVLAACSARVGSAGGSAAQTVAVVVTPGDAQLAPGQSAQFTSQVTGTALTAVTWRVDEVGGGTVDAQGGYVAPANEGDYHVRAVSEAAPAASAAAAVHVRTAPSVTISPATATVGAGATVAFTATTAGLGGAGVAWSLQEASGCGSVTQAGLYTAPGAAATCHVVATSLADGTRSAVATVTVTKAAVTVTIAPASGTVDACKTLAFTATVAGGADGVVAWSTLEATGTITSAGLYTAPAAAGTYHVVATNASSGASAQATVTVQDHVLSVAVTPTTASLTTGQGRQFTATVTTTCGTFAATAQ